MAQPSYAPELNITGIAVGGFVSRPDKILAALNGGPFAGFLPSTLPGIIRGNPIIKPSFKKHLTPAGRRLLASGDSRCVVSNLALYPLLNMNRYLTIPYSRLLALPPVEKGLKAMALRRGTPMAPVLVYQAVLDELVPEADAAETVAKWCKRGARVKYVRDLVSDHVSLALTGAPLALQWLNARLGGERVGVGCSTTTTLSTLLIPGVSTTSPGSSKPSFPRH
ncbi:lipase family protein [Nocardioides pelophilus]|uniref:lipase family protein n=1 Tax=Nocardioides pelophilus TaxID=2172019 RepID=UPI0035E3FD01